MLIFSWRERKLELTKKLKKYYLNNLFTNINIPKLRFNGFNDNLLKTSLSNLIVINKFKQISAEELYTLKNKNGIVKLLPSSQDYDWFSNINVDDKRVCHGKIIALGRARYANLKKWDGYFISANNVIIENNENVDFNFLYYLIDKNKEKFYVVKTTYPTFSIDVFNKFKCCVPVINEQKKIAIFLSFIDQKIDLLSNKKLKLIERKTYYLNSLFI